MRILLLLLLSCLHSSLSSNFDKQREKLLKKFPGSKDEIKEKLLNNPEIQKLIEEYTSCKKPQLHELLNLTPTNRDVKLIREDHPLIGATTPELIMYYDYPVETHYVTTEDGYVLEIHRMPCPREGCQQGEIREAIILQHGLLCSSSDWVVNPPHQSLGFLLVDAGYDVWLTNYRGNKYGKNHIELNPRDESFWYFTWDEMGEFDLPAAIDYVLYRTGFDQVYYVGHSMGTTGFFTMAHKKPEYNNKVRAFFALAPAATTDNMQSPMRIFAPFLDIIEWFVLDVLGMYEFMPGGPFMDWIAKTFCDDEAITQMICSNIMFLLCGYNEKQLNTTMIPVYASITPAGSSTMSVIHYVQNHNSEVFRDYDYGKEMNEEIYGEPVPPAYDLSKVTAPTYIYWGENDWIADPVDVMELAAELSNLRLLFRVEDDKYTHLDFTWGIGSRFLLYEPIMSELSSMQLPFRKTPLEKFYLKHEVVTHKKRSNL